MKILSTRKGQFPLPMCCHKYLQIAFRQRAYNQSRWFLPVQNSDRKKCFLTKKNHFWRIKVEMGCRRDPKHQIFHFEVWGKYFKVTLQKPGLNYFCSCQ